MAINMERRNYLRKATDEFAFVQLDRENGGVVLNVSEGGLRFRANTPILQASPIYVWFWLNIGDRIEAVAETAWTDEARKEGGLRFSRLSETARNQIQTFLGRSGPPGSPANAPLPPPAPTLVPPAPRSSNPAWDLNSSAAPAALWEPELAPSGHQSPAASREQDTLPFTHVDPAPSGVTQRDVAPSHRTIPPPPSSRLYSIPETARLEEDRAAPFIPAERPQTSGALHFFRGFFVGILLSALAAIPVFVILMRHANSGASPKSSSNTPSAQSQPPSSPAPSYPLNAAPSAKSKKAAPAAPTTAQTATTAVNPPRVAPHAANDLQIPVQPANNSPFSKMTPERLWAAVKEGNPRAEVALADLYLHGDGVPQNCDQARVLLTAAAQKKFPEAIKKLQQLDEQGCPSD